MRMRFFVHLAFFISMFVVFTAVSSSSAQTITTIQELDFGLVMDRGGARSRIFANTDGSFSTNRGIEFITNPQPAEIAISDAAGFSSYSVVKTNPRRADLTTAGFFVRVNNFNFASPDAFTIDGAGNGSFFMGGRLNTRRVSNAPYPEATFNGDVEIEITFFP